MTVRKPPLTVRQDERMMSLAGHELVVLVFLDAVDLASVPCDFDPQLTGDTDLQLPSDFDLELSTDFNVYVSTIDGSIGQFCSSNKFPDALTSSVSR